MDAFLAKNSNNEKKHKFGILLGTPKKKWQKKKKVISRKNP